MSVNIDKNKYYIIEKLILFLSNVIICLLISMYIVKYVSDYDDIIEY